MSKNKISNLELIIATAILGGLIAIGGYFKIRHEASRFESQPVYLDINGDDLVDKVYYGR